MKTILFLLAMPFAFYGCSDSEPKDVDPSHKTDSAIMPENKSNLPESKYDFVIENSCGFDRAMIKEKVYSFDSDTEADNALQRIMKLTGLPANFEIKASSVDNACAVIKCDDEGNCDRYILYNQEFMEKIKDETSTNYTELAILAHEIAHHLSGHTLSSKGNSYDMELESDKFAGFMLYKLGATIEEAKRTYSSLSEAGSKTHPPRSARIAALTNGWYDAKRNGEKIVTINTSSKNSNELNSNVGASNNGKTKKSSQNETWFIYHRMCSKNGKFYVTEGKETAYCTGCSQEYYLRWSGGTDIQTGKPYVLDYMETESSRNNRSQQEVFKKHGF